MIRKSFLFIIILFIVIFFWSIAYYYTSLELKSSIEKNRLKINSSFKEKKNNLPYLKNDTNNVIEFNSGYNEIDENKQRKFWNLFKK